MDQVEILILNDHPSPEIAADLTAIISALSNVRVSQMRCGTVDIQDTATAARSTVGLAIRKADLVFTVLKSPTPLIVRSIHGALQSLDRHRPLVLVTDSDASEEIIEYLRIGIADHLSIPLRHADALPRIWRLIAHVQKRKTLTERLKEKIGLKQIIGTSLAITAEVRKIPLVAGCDSGVLISGETGTGKEMFARAIHYLGPRSGKPFIPVNCGAIPAELVENELFGHVRGAFTGANLSHDGLVSEASGGTIFLDEIDCLPAPAQVKLLRLLQEKEFRKIGSTKMQRTDVRVISAANSDLAQAVEQGRFRQDLFYRLNIVQMTIPPLRERREDIPFLAEHFVALSSDEHHRPDLKLSAEALQKLCAYHWPGNVRELENTIKRAVIFANASVILEEEIDLPQARYPKTVASFQAEKAKVVAEFEKKYMCELLVMHRGNISHAARAARKNRRAFWELMRKYNIDVAQYKHIPPHKQDI